MKKKFLLFMFAFLFLPGVFYFSGCGKEKVTVNGFNVYIDDVIFSQNNKTIYLDYGDTDDWKDLIKVKKTYSDNKEELISEKTASTDGYTITVTPETQTFNADTYTVVITYGDFSSVTITMIVDRLSIAKPTAITGLVYNGESQLGVNYLADAGYTVSGDVSHTDAGEHTATFTLDSNHKWADGTTDPVEITWTIAKQEVAVPTIESKVYNGSKQTADIQANPLYTITNNGGTDVGEYDVILTLTDSDNYYFAGDTTKLAETKTLTFNISQATNTMTGTLSMNGWTYKSEINSPDATELELLFGDKADLTYTYHADEDCETADLTMSSLTNAGTYYVKVTLAGTNNYTEVSTIVRFTIAKKNNSLTSGITIDNYQYTGVAPSPTATAEFGEVTYKYFTDEECANEVDEVLNVGTYYVKAFVAESTNYNAFESVAKSFEITQATNEISTALTMSGWTYKDAEIATPNMEAKFGEVKYEYYMDEVCEGDKYTMSYLTDAGTYYVKAYVEETVNFTAVSSIKSFVIAKKNNTFTTQPSITGWSYSSRPLAPIAEAEFGEIQYEYYSNQECTESVVINEYTNVGTYYMLAKVAESNNYNELVLSTPISFQITKAENSFVREIESGYGWEYSSDPVYPIASAKFGTVTYKYYSDEACEEEIDTPTSSTNAGTYYVKAFVQGTDNYSSLESEAKTLVITQKMINTPGWGNTTFEYTGEKITLEIIGVDDSMATIVGDEQTNAGNYTAVITLNSNYKFHFEESNVYTIGWCIEEKWIEQPTISGTYTFIYNGSTQGPTIINYNEDYMDIVEGSVTSAIDANEEWYKITYRIKQNYRWSYQNEDVELTWYINKQQVSAPTGNNVCHIKNDTDFISVIEYDTNKFDIVYESVEYEGQTYTTKSDLAGTEVGIPYYFILKLKNSNYEWDYSSLYNAYPIYLENETYVCYTWYVIEENPFETITLTKVGEEPKTILMQDLLTMQSVDYGTILNITMKDGYTINGDIEYSCEIKKEPTEYISIMVTRTEDGESIINQQMSVNIDIAPIISSIQVGEDTYSYSDFLSLTHIEYKETVKVNIATSYANAGYTSNYSQGVEFVGANIIITENSKEIMIPVPSIDYDPVNVMIGSDTYTWEEFKQIDRIGYGETIQFIIKESYSDIDIAFTLNEAEFKSEFVVDNYGTYNYIDISSENFNLWHNFESYIEIVKSLKLNDQEIKDYEYANFDFGDTLTITKNSLPAYDNITIKLVYNGLDGSENAVEITNEENVYSAVLNKYNSDGNYNQFVGYYVLKFVQNAGKDNENELKSYHFNMNDPEFKIKINDTTYERYDLDSQIEVDHNSKIKPILEEGYQLKYFIEGKTESGTIANSQEFVLSQSGYYNFSVVYTIDGNIDVSIKMFRVSVRGMELKFTVDDINYGRPYVEEHLLQKNQQTVTIVIDKDMFDSITKSGSKLTYGNNIEITSNTLEINISELNSNNIEIYLDDESVANINLIKYQSVLGVTYYALGMDSIKVREARQGFNYTYDENDNPVKMPSFTFDLTNEFLAGFEVELESDTMTYKIFYIDEEVSIQDICSEIKSKNYTMKIYDSGTEIDTYILDLHANIYLGSDFASYKYDKLFYSTTTNSVSLPVAGQVDQDLYPGYNGITISLPKDFEIVEGEYGIYYTTVTMATSYNSIDYSKSVELMVYYNQGVKDYITQIRIETGVSEYEPYDKIYTYFTQYGYISSGLDASELLALKYDTDRDTITLAEGWSLIPETQEETPVKVKYMEDICLICLEVKITNGTDNKTFIIPVEYSGEISNNITIKEATVTDFVSIKNDLTELLNNSINDIIIEAQGKLVFEIETEEDSTLIDVYYGSTDKANLKVSDRGSLEILLDQAGKYYVVITSSDGTKFVTRVIDFQADELLPFFSGWLTTDTNKENTINVELTLDGMGGNIMVETNQYYMPEYALGYLGDVKLEENQETVTMSAISYLSGISYHDGTGYKVVEDLNEIELEILTNDGEGAVPNLVGEKYVVLYLYIEIAPGYSIYMPLYMYLCAPKAMYAFDVQYGEDHVYASLIDGEVDTNCSFVDEFVQMYIGDLYNVDLDKTTIDLTIKSDLFADSITEMFFTEPYMNPIISTLHSFKIQEDTMDQIKTMTGREGKFIMFAFAENSDVEEPIYVVIFLNEGPAPTT